MSELREKVERILVAALALQDDFARGKGKSEPDSEVTARAIDALYREAVEPVAHPPSPSPEVEPTHAYVQDRLRQIDTLRAQQAHDKLKIDGLKKRVERLRKALEETAEGGCEGLSVEQCDRSHPATRCHPCTARRALQNENTQEEG